jgi:transglutaminase-like putative cysteine protease
VEIIAVYLAIVPISVQQPSVQQPSLTQSSVQQSSSIFTKIRHQMVMMPKIAPEESLLLRVLVQSMVVVGIVATDVAAETQLSLWAIPLSLIGATWSWHHRHGRNIGIKFGLAFAMLGAMGYFVAHLVGSLNDTRLVLAELLVQMQVIHTFDLPRRKDLGYSMTIGLILISVAGTLSQTLTFAPLLLLFLTIAIPVLWLDYRSRLNLPPLQITNPAQISQLGLPWQKLGQLLGIVLAIGLVVFALMPRFPGYQGSLPMSAPIQYEQQKFDAKAMINPGYQHKGKASGGKGAPQVDGQGGDSKSDGTLDENFYYGFNSKIDQNLRGMMKPKLVLRVRAQAPGFWRALAFDRYTGQGWEISRNAQTQKVRRPEWDYKFTIDYPRTRMPTKQVIQSYTALEELPNIIPGMSSVSELYFPTPEIAIDPEGVIRSPVGLQQNLTYTVVSQVAYRDRQLLDTAPTDYPKTITNHYLQIPDQIAPKLQKFTQDLVDHSTQQQVGENSPALSSNYAKALYLAQYLKQHYQLPVDPLTLDRVPVGADLASWFLFRCAGKSTSCTAGGYGDHFVTTYTMMLRSIGIPARLVVGFDPGRFNPFTGFYEVANTDAHALTEVYFPKYGWFAFDPIPGHPLTPPGVDEDQTFSTLGQLWNWVASWLPSPVTAWLGYLWSSTLGWLAIGIARFFGLFHQGWLGIFAGSAIAIAISFCAWWGWQQWAKWRHRQWLKKLAPVDRVYQQMLIQLRETGTPKHPAQTPLEYAQVVRDQRSATTSHLVTEISQAYTAWRYGAAAQRVDRLQELLISLSKENK